ncbi:ribosomal RNA small subunit methyltransferase A [Candidatus Berkelbacteria bacterium RBG_13_40_8]|uniref:Ribosomal RNA small subunit methyltransferase A n=1 Tax=Candidatus Berkelbacteria bacterium RBG_13_40_8 TaxID=1797467 RepID=A0A1F5DPZ5_9BACT|nr:MAG: ribosomal RNA small subunit methyltransferase A [Candidatus Berkelbacteria bacterium RBG_13_40_8]
MFRPKKQLGQNFLINDKILPEIINAAEITSGDIIIEIGPGMGILTETLLKAGAKVFAVEKDFDLIAHLTKKFSNNKNLKIIHQDALWLDLTQFNPSTPLGAGGYKVVANLPFNVASPLIRKFLESPQKPKLMVVMVQKEVAEKIIAKPGDSERGILTLAVEFYADAKIVKKISKNNFRPQPAVDAAILKIVPKIKSDIEPKLFFRIVKAGFASKRRQVHNSLSATLRLEKNVVLEILKKAKIEPTLRAEDLTLEQWLKLAKVFIKQTPRG